MLLTELIMTLLLLFIYLYLFNSLAIPNEIIKVIKSLIPEEDIIPKSNQCKSFLVGVFFPSLFSFLNVFQFTSASSKECSGRFLRVFFGTFHPRK